MIARFGLKSVFFVPLLGCALMSLAACDEMGLPRDGSGSQMLIVPSYPQLAPIAPPRAPIEREPVLSDPAHTTWRAGYYDWNGSGFDWVPGEIIAKPSPTAVWRPSFWITHTYGWAYVPGYWQ